MADQQDQWVIQCHDPFKRERNMRVFLSEEGEVGIQAPPPGSGILGPRAVSLLRDALDQAVIAAHQRGGRS